MTRINKIDIKHRLDQDVGGRWAIDMQRIYKTTTNCSPVSSCKFTQTATGRHCLSMNFVAFSQEMALFNMEDIGPYSPYS